MNNQEVVGEQAGGSVNVCLLVVMWVHMMLVTVISSCNILWLVFACWNEIVQTRHGDTTSPLISKRNGLKKNNNKKNRQGKVNEP